MGKQMCAFFKILIPDKKNTVKKSDRYFTKQL